MTSKFIKPGVRTRIAPSPTGFLHIGTSRTALFNYLFVKKYQGQFVLRIEDTDLERSDIKFEKDIIEGLKWLGLQWDEGPEVGGDFSPYRQSERTYTYAKYIQRLIDEEKAYHCFCSQEELDAQRSNMMTAGMAPIYSGKCRNLSKQEVTERLSAENKHIIRFKMPSKKISFTDLVKGKLEFDTALIGDIAIAKSVSIPLYNFAVVVDDFEMKITHVIRGEDHISNTPKQIALFEALDFSIPEFAHLPLILGSDRSKMSKRDGATSIIEYKETGFLPEALINFIALLGWNPGDSREIFSLEELVSEFSVERIQKSGAIFNIQKLESINSYYIKNKPIEELTKLCEPYFEKAGLKIGFEKLKKIVKLEQERIKRLSEILEVSKLFFEETDYAPEILVWKKSDKATAIKALQIVLAEFEKINDADFSMDRLKPILDSIITKFGGAGEVFWPFRVALSGQQSSPPPLEIAEILGKNESLTRIQVAINKLI